MFVIESMDVDSETRPLEPIALLGDGYLNMLNGPSNPCYTFNCRQRLSTFMSVVGTGTPYSLFKLFDMLEKNRLRE